MGLLSNNIARSNDRDAKAAAIAQYLTNNEARIASEYAEGYGPVRIDASEAIGSSVNLKELEAIIDHFTSSGFETPKYHMNISYDTRFEAAPVLLIECESLSGSERPTNRNFSSGFSTSNTPNEDNETEHIYESHIVREYESKEKKQQKKIAAMPMPSEDECIMELSECELYAAEARKKWGGDSQDLAKAWETREKLIIKYAQTKFANNSEIMNAVKEAQHKLNMRKNRKKRLKELEELKERKNKKATRITWLTWLALTVFFIAMGDAFWYEWWTYVLVILGSILLAAILFFFLDDIVESIVDAKYAKEEKALKDDEEDEDDD